MLDGIYMIKLGFFEGLEAIPVVGLIMVCSEWWTFEIGGFVTGSVDGVQLAACTITFNVIGTGYIVRG